MIITTTNLKGGSGKTALAVNLAALFAEQHRTLLVDLDTQADASLALGIKDSGRALKNILSGGGDASLSDGVLSTASGVDLMPSGEAVGHVLDHVQPDALMGCRRWFQSYDIVVIDCPPGLGNLVAAAWMVADTALVPVDGPEALRAVARLEQAWRDLRLERERIRLVPNRIDRRRVLDRELVRQAQDAYEGRVLPEIRETVVVRESAAWKKPLSQHYPAHGVTADLRSLSREVLNG